MSAVSIETRPIATSFVGPIIDGGSLELVEVLGIHDHSVTYRAIHFHLRKVYAVKCLVPTERQFRKMEDQISKIALQQLASLHPGVVTLHRIIDDGGRKYIVMDYAPNHDLYTQIYHSRRYLGNDMLIKDVSLQLIDALDYCHSLKIYHRNLKLQNILCFDDGRRVAITDFSLATTDEFSDEYCAGSVSYMSPEYYSGRFFAWRYSPMFNDIWSLGIILLNLVTGLNPWEAATHKSPMFEAYLHDPVGFLPSVLPISPATNNILVRMLEVDWQLRQI